MGFMLEGEPLFVYTLCILTNEVIPFLVENPEVFALGDYIFIPNLKTAICNKIDRITAYAVKPDGNVITFLCSIGSLTDTERQILTEGCLINYYRNN